MTFSQAVITNFKHKSFRFYGRSSRHEFWYFYVALLAGGALCFCLSFVPIVGSLLVALGILYLCCCHITALVRRLHDCNRSGKLVALPFLLLLAYFVARIPLHALYQDYAAMTLNGILGLSILSYILLLGLCCQQGSKGNNRYGTDPLDSSVPAQDFINPEHLEMPEYLGDPWRKFKAKHDRQNSKNADPNSSESSAQNTPSSEDNATK